MKVMKNLFFLFVLLALASCGSGKLAKNEAVSDQEAILLGQFKIVDNGRDVTKNSRIYFDENVKGVLDYKLDETGLLVMKVPKGNHFIKLIYTPYGSVNLPDGYALLTAAEGGKVHYIGTIEIDGSGQLQKKFSGIVNDVQAKDLKEKKVPIVVSDKRQEALEAYEKEYEKTSAVISLLKVGN